jgi:hypothetical protein
MTTPGIPVGERPPDRKRHRDLEQVGCSDHVRVSLANISTTPARTSAPMSLRLSA